MQVFGIDQHARVVLRRLDRPGTPPHVVTWFAFLCGAKDKDSKPLTMIELQRIAAALLIGKYESPTKKWTLELQKKVS